MNNSDLKLTGRFNLEGTPSCRITDTTNYAVPPSGTGAVNPDYVTVYMKLTTPVGVVHNSYPAANSVGTPDVCPFLSETYVDINLPLNDDDEVEVGTYTFETKVREWTTPLGVGITSADAATKTFSLTGNVAAAITALIGRYFIVSGSTAGVNNGVYTVVSATYNGVTTDVVVSETVVNDTAGLFVYFSGYTDYEIDPDTITYSVYFDFTAPTAAITKSFSCKTAEIVLTDATSYIAVNNSVNLSPASTSKTLSAVAPLNPDGTGFSPTTTTSTDNTMTLSDVWTGLWSLGIYTQLTYNINTWFSILVGVQQMETMEVECEECSCTYYLCIYNLWNNYNRYRTTNLTRANTVKSILQELNINYMLYQMALQCGYDPTPFCTKIDELAGADDCICTGDSTTDISVPVVAWGGGSGSGSSTGAAWYNGSGAPSSSLGSNGDYYLNDDNGYYYKKVVGSWVYQGTLMLTAPEWLNGSGAPAAGTGNVGDYYLDNTTKQYYEKTGASIWTLIGVLASFIKMHGDVSDNGTIASASPQILKTYTLPAGTMNTQYDEVIVETMFTMRAGLPASTLRITIFLGAAAMYNYSWVAPGNPSGIRINTKFALTTASTQLKGTSEAYDYSTTPTEVVVTGLKTIAVNMTVAQDITVVATTVNAGVNDIVCNYFNVYVVKK